MAVAAALAWAALPSRPAARADVPGARGAAGESETVLSPELRDIVAALEAIDGPEERADALRKLARAPLAAGDRASALTLLRRAARAAGSVEPGRVAWHYMPPMLVQVAEAQAEAGDRPAARDTLRRATRLALALPIGYNQKRGKGAHLHYLRDVVSAQARMGDRDAARTTFDTALRMAREDGEDSLGPTYLPVYLAGLRASLGDFDGALALIGDPAQGGGPGKIDHGNGLREIADRVRPGDRSARPALERMAAMAAASKNAFFKQYVDRSLVEAQLRAGDPRGALRTVRALDGSRDGPGAGIRGEDSKFEGGPCWRGSPSPWTGRATATPPGRPCARRSR